MTGIELIAKERQEQIEKHGRTVQKDFELYSAGYGNMSQLTFVADILIKKTFTRVLPPKGWDKDIFNKIITKPYKERLIIAGALIAAEIDMMSFKFPDNSKQVVKPKNDFIYLDYNGMDKIQQGSFTCKQCAIGQVMNTNCVYILNTIGNSIQCCDNCGYDNYFDVRGIIKTDPNEKD